jgi:hypothetical protein
MGDPSIGSRGSGRVESLQILMGGGCLVELPVESWDEAGRAEANGQVLKWKEGI